MSQLTSKEIDILSKKILEDYDANNPGTIFKDKIVISNLDASILQSTVSKLREKRGEEVIGYKIGCVLKYDDGVEAAAKAKLDAMRKQAYVGMPSSVFEMDEDDLDMDNI